LKLKHLLVCLSLGLTAAGPASAQVFGQFSGADPLPVNGRLFGGYVHSSNDVVGLVGQLRLSFYPSVDFGFQGGISRYDSGSNSGSHTTVRLGADFKVSISAQDVYMPVAISAGGAIGVETGDNFSVLKLGPTLVASRSLRIGDNGELTPFASVGLHYSRIDVGTTDDTDVSFPLRFGVDTLVAPHIRLLVELQVQISDEFGDDTTLAAGVNLPF